MYDVANRASFEDLERWLVEAADFGAGGIPMAVCANKVRMQNPNKPHIYTPHLFVYQRRV